MGGESLFADALKSQQYQILLDVWALNKNFGRKRVISDFTYSFRAGIYSLVGPNGAGKSTLLGLLAGAQNPDSGRVSIGGDDLAQNPVETKRRLGYAPDEKILYPFMKGMELLQLVICAKGFVPSKQQEYLIRGFKLEPYTDMVFRQMSQGTKKKFTLIAAFLGNSSVLLMDEPSNALDKESLEFLKILIKGASRQQAIIFASHDIDFIEATGAQVIGPETYAASLT